MNARKSGRFIAALQKPVPAGVKRSSSSRMFGEVVDLESSVMTSGKNCFLNQLIRRAAEIRSWELREGMNSRMIRGETNRTFFLNLLA